MWDLIVSVPDHYLLFYFEEMHWQGEMIVYNDEI